MDRFDKIFRRVGGPSGFLLLLVGLAFPEVVGAQLPPDENWKTLDTPHLRVTYPQGLEALARRAGDRGETAWRLLSQRFVNPPSGKIDMVVTDHADVSNGFSNVFPSNRIVIFASPPVDGFTLSHMDEWLELVVTHEMVHIFHEDLARGPGKIVRTLFGRVPTRWPTFPGSAMPGWMIEGVAVYYESSLTGAGRVRGSFHDMVLRTGILEGGFETLNQASSDGPQWPGGQRFYIYGSLFLDHLSKLYGEESMGRFAEAVAGQWVPFRLDAAAKDAFGVSFTTAWKAWARDLEDRYGALEGELREAAPLTEGETLSHEGYYALNPQPSPDGATLAYTSFDGRSDTQIRLLDLATGKARELTRVNRLANLDWTPQGDLLFSQVEYTDSYRIRGDLYRVTPRGSVTRLTAGARLDHPDMAPSGDAAVAVQERGGTNRLVLVDLDSGSLRPLTDFDPIVHWSYPRWSPDGKWIAATRWRQGAYYNLVLLDPEGGVVHEVTRDRAVDIAPTWSPDGRWILWSSDRSGIPNLYAVSVDADTGTLGGRRQVTNVLGGAAYPSVDPGARWIYFSGYHADGWHVERIPFEPSAWFDPLPPKASLAVSVDTTHFRRRAQGPVREYRPLQTLRPTYWEPQYRSADHAGSVQVLDPGYGFSTTGQDLVGRHRYALSGTWSSGPALFNGGASYAWAGLGNPVFGAAFTQYSDADGPYSAPDESGDPLFIVERERTLGLGATLTRRRSRTISSLTLSGNHIWQHRTLLDESLAESEEFFLHRPDSRLAEGKVSLSFGNARRQPFSVSPEDGVGIFLRGRARRELALADSIRNVAGDDQSLQDLIGQLNLFRAFRLPGFGNHVLALRGSGGVARGPAADAYHFEVGGASGSDGPALLDLGKGLFFPVRGYATARRYGRFAWTASAEYRFPIVLTDWGPGLFPLHLDWLSGTVFVDGGNAWGTELDVVGHENPRRAALVAVGAELTARLLPLWYRNLEFRFGVGIPLVEGDGARAYLRLGPSF